MKKIILAVFVLFFALAFPSFAYALQFSAGESLDFKSEQTIADDFYVFGSNVDLKSTIDGDLIILGSRINFSGNTSGDLTVAGADIKISGTVGDDLRIGGGQVEISGSVSDDVIIGGGRVTLTKEAKIGGDLIVGAGMVEIKGIVEGAIKGNGGSLEISGEIWGTSNVRFNQVIVKSGAKIINLTYKSPREATIEDNTEISIISFKKIDRKTGKAGAVAVQSFWRLLSFLGYLIVALILIKLLPKVSEKTAELCLKESWKTFLVGLVILIFIPAVAIMAMITLVGLQLGAVLLAIYTALIFLATIPVAICIGNIILKIFNKKASLALKMVLGLTAVYLVRLIPLIGGAISFIILCIGIGVIIVFFYNLYNSKKETVK